MNEDLITEFFYLQKFDTVEQFREELIDYLDYYYNLRIKLKLNGLTPV
ncbi:MAG: IS3 family transposase [Ruminococcus sp.]|nr:IS3 family transposase [Ruminococcus sp.]